MPIYEYKCEQCGEMFEKFIRSSAQLNSLRCPECGGGDVRKMISLFGCCATSQSKGTGAFPCGPNPV